jgi:O-antigen ligase
MERSMNKTEVINNSEKINIHTIIACLYFACMPLSIVPIPGNISLLKFFSIFSGLALILALFLSKNISEIQFNIVHLFIGLYVIYSISSLFLLYDANAWVILRGNIETTALLYIISFRIYNEKEKKALFNSWLIAGIITLAAMFFNSVEFGMTGRLTIGIGSGNEDPNQLCGYFFVPMLICIEKIVNRTKYKILYVFLLLAMLYVSFATGSRGGLAAIFATIAVYSFMIFKSVGNKFKKTIALLLLFTIFFMVFYPLLPDSVKDRMTIESVVEDKGSGRFDLWTIVYDAITESKVSLIFGYGLGSTAYFLQEADKQNTVAHNHWLQVWCDQGFIGLLLFFLVVLFGGIRALPDDKIIAASLFGMFVLSMSLTLYASYKPFWNILMMSAMNYEGVRYIE